MKRNVHDTAQELAVAAEQAERAHDPEDVTQPTDLVPSKRRPQNPSESFSVRIPTDQLKRLRELAEQTHTTPSALMRTWVLERLETNTESHDESVLPDEVAQAVIRIAENTARDFVRTQIRDGRWKAS